MILSSTQRCKLLAFAIFLSAACSKSSGSRSGPAILPVIPPQVATTDVAFYKTTGDKSSLLTRQNISLVFGTAPNQLPVITVDSAQTYQTMDGFGYTLTGGSADVINGLSSSTKNELLRELFATDTASMGISYLRLSIGASDLSSTVYTYDDMPSGQTDINLANFNLSKDTLNLIPLLKQILTINPTIKILGSPWTAPLWMKTNGNSVGGRLNTAYYSVYADYFVKYIQHMKEQGITIDAITPQNEPLHGGNNPSMEMSATEQAEFIKNNLGPKLRTANLSTKIIIYDHNCDNPQYPLTVLNDAAAAQYIDGSGFHLYNGSISALTTVHDAYPSKNVYFTEQYTAAGADFSGDLVWHLRNLIIGAPRNWSKNVLQWNLAADANNNPHSPGGCTTCLGAITISGNNIIRNVSYYIVSHASRFVKPGSVRIASNVVSNLQNVAFVTPAGKKVLIVLNDNNNSQTFNIRFKDKWVTTDLDAKAVGTFIW